MVPHALCQRRMRALPARLSFRSIAGLNFGPRRLRGASSPDHGWEHACLATFSTYPMDGARPMSKASNLQTTEQRAVKSFVGQTCCLGYAPLDRVLSRAGASPSGMKRDRCCTGSTLRRGFRWHRPKPEGDLQEARSSPRRC